MADEKITRCIGEHLFFLVKGMESTHQRIKSGILAELEDGWRAYKLSSEVRHVICG